MENSEQPITIIGGISGGIGSKLAVKLAQQGKRVIGFARDSAKLDALKAENPGIETEICDATSPQALKDYFNKVTSTYGRIDTYVHAIGSIFLKPVHLTSDKDWDRTLEINLNSAFYALREVAGYMNKGNGGACLFFSTAAARIGIANHEAIAAAKGGIEAMVRAAAATYVSRNIRINAIAPSLTDTPLAQPMTGNPQMLEASKRMHPLGDIVQPQDVASLAEWLISEHAKSVTGQIFTLDGGISSIVPKPKL